MKLGRKDETNGGGLRATALVVAADRPLTNASRWGNAGKGSVTILVDVGSDTPIHVARRTRLTEDRWLVGGMEIPVSIDPAKPEEFEVDWDAIPSIEERVAANDPALADPLAAQRKVAEALKSAGVTEPALGLRQHGMTQGGFTRTVASGDPTPDRLAEAIEKAASQPAPPGKQRAVVVLATITESADSSTGGDIPTHDIDDF